MTYTHDEVKAIIKFVLEEERLLDLAEKVQPIPEEDRHVEETMPEVTAEEKEKPSAPEPKPKKAAPKKRRVRLDYGKIGALHRAGWSAAKIADEKRCDLSSVYRAIREKAWEKEETR